MDRFHQLKVYIAVAEAEGFNAAARKLAMSPPAVTRAVAALEDELGVKLLNRTTRYVRTTDVGLQYLEDAKRILHELSRADEAVVGINSEPQGHLVVTAPVLFGRHYITDGITDYLNRYPKMTVEAMFLDRVVNLLEEGIDVGVRIGELADSSMRARKVGQIRMVCCASPEYLKTHGIPQTPEDLQTHTCIQSKAGSGVSEWRFPDKPVALKPRLLVNTNDAAIKAATDGFGITRVLSYQIKDELSKGRLKILLENYEPAPRPVHIVHREGRLAAIKVRAFVDLLVERLSQDKSLN